jgi:hypothetical protein
MEGSAKSPAFLFMCEIDSISAQFLNMWPSATHDPVLATPQPARPIPLSPNHTKVISALVDEMGRFQRAEAPRER